MELGDIVQLVLEKLNANDESVGEFALVKETLDPYHPTRFDGHNADSCRIPTLVVVRECVLGKLGFRFYSIDVRSPEHRARREQHKSPKWDKESIVFHHASAAAAYLKLLCDNRGVDVYKRSIVNELMDEHKDLGHLQRYGPLRLGTLPTFEQSEARAAISLLCGIKLGR